MCRVCTHPLSEKYAIFDIAESRFLAYNASKSFVAGLRLDPLGELTAPPDPLAAFDGPTSNRGKGWGKEGGKGRGNGTHPL